MTDWQGLANDIYHRKLMCYFCSNKNKRYLCIHHIDGNPANDTKNNLLVLCRKCHKRLHNRIYRALGIKVVSKRKTKLFNKSINNYRAKQLVK